MLPCSQHGGPGKRTALSDPPSSSIDQAQQCLQPSQRKRRSSGLGREQGLVFLASTLVRKMKHKEIIFCRCWQDFLPFLPPPITKPTRASGLPDLWPRGTGTTGDWFTCQYWCSQGAQVIVSWIPTTQLTGRGIGERAITFTEETLTVLSAPTDTLTVTHAAHLQSCCLTAAFPLIQVNSGRTQLSQCCHFVLLFMYGTCRIQHQWELSGEIRHFLGENHTSLYLHFVQSTLALQPLLRSKTRSP